MTNIKYDTIRYLSHIEVASEEDMARLEQQRRQEQQRREYQHSQISGLQEDSDGEAPDKVAPQPVLRQSPKVGRNDPCTCGSGKKYKHCCGKI